MLPSRVLVIEDDRPIRTLVVELLRDEGHEVRGAANGSEGLVHLEWLPDVILLDLMMPVMDGPTFRTRQLELEAPMSEIPVIVLTAGRDTSEIDAMGVAGSVEKPFDEDHLLATVEAVLEDNRDA